MSVPPIDQAIAILLTFDSNRVIPVLYHMIVRCWQDAVSRDNACAIIVRYTTQYAYGPVTANLRTGQVVGIVFDCNIIHIMGLPAHARPAEALRILHVLHSIHLQLVAQRRIDWQVEYAAHPETAIAHAALHEAHNRQRREQYTAQRATAAANEAARVAINDRVARDLELASAEREANMTWPGGWPEEEPWDAGYSHG